MPVFRVQLMDMADTGKSALQDPALGAQSGRTGQKKAGIWGTPACLEDEIGCETSYFSWIIPAIILLATFWESTS